MKITRMGHAAVVIEVGRTRVLIDPGGTCPDGTFAPQHLEAVAG